MKQLQLNTSHIEDLLDILNEGNLASYKQVLSGSFDVRKGKEWKLDLTTNRLTAKSVEVFEGCSYICFIIKTL